MLLQLLPLEVISSTTNWDLALFLQMWIYVEQDPQIAYVVLAIGRKDLVSPALSLTKKGGEMGKKELIIFKGI